jgi:hypothetical protein
MPRLQGIFPPHRGPSVRILDTPLMRKKYIERAKARLQACGLPITVPRGSRETHEGPLAWTCSELPGEFVFIYHLTAEDKEEIVAALRHFNTLIKQCKHVDRASFPLPNLQREATSDPGQSVSGAWV